jgi:hypothetical protein
MSTNGRLESLYKLFGIDDPFISSEYPVEDAMNKELDYRTVDDALSLLRENSIKYLSEALDFELH